MSLYETWIQTAYDSQGSTNKKFWSTYIPVETKIYEDLLADKGGDGYGGLTMPLSEFAAKYKLKPEYAVGFLDGISGALEQELDIESVDEDYVIDIRFNYENLFKKMVEYKAKHLYTLPVWNNYFTPEEQERIIDIQRKSRTVTVGDKPGRNDPCPCGSGKKYKKCCAMTE